MTTDMSALGDIRPDELLAAVQAQRRRRSLIEFGHALYSQFSAPRHIQLLASHLEAVERGDITRLIVQMPPRHGKSVCTSHLFPAWYLGRNPDRSVIACSYGAELAYAFSRRARNTVASAEYREIFPAVSLAPDAQSLGQWELCNPLKTAQNGTPERYQGGYVSAGVGGGITGRGADLLLIDDPLSSAEAAASKTILDGIWEWWSSTASTRLHPSGTVVLVQTRWAEDDLAGRLQREGDWTVLNLPAVAEEGDALGRQPGEPLWPDRYDVEALEQRKIESGSRAFAALYQQRPTPAGGAIFKREWFENTYQTAPAGQTIQVWDTAFQAKQTADYSACATWRLSDNRAYLLHAYRDRLEFPELERKAVELAQNWHPDAVLIEKRASGQSLIQTLTRDTKLPIVAVDTPAGEGKELRAHSVTPYFEGNRVWLPAYAPWLEEWIEEHLAFPAAAHDDFVDTTSHALRRLFPAEQGPMANRLAVSGPRPITQFQPR